MRLHAAIRLGLIAMLTGAAVPSIRAADPLATLETARGNTQLTDFYKTETARVARNSPTERSLEAWQAARCEYRRQLFEMLGLDPLPKKSDLKPVVTGTVKHAEFTVENLHFQSLPGLYVTGNLYLPVDTSKPCPTILYLCGHGREFKDGVAYGNKTHYQHHGEWFARHGYACLTLDTIQLGEIEGIHHGTFKFDMWWWNSLGYTPAGVEAWNCIRALDYLQTRKEVDSDRIGATGRSGGGAYSWWIAALDERIKVAVPVAGITDLQNHVLDGCVDGHCDCMYMVNTYRWDYGKVAALVAPRPLLITNTDRDGIFPLDGVYRIHQQVKPIYKLYGAVDKLGLQISEGPHKDTQELQVAAFHWFNRYLKREESIIEKPAVPLLRIEQLKVFEKLPTDERVTKIQESFVQLADSPSVPADGAAWSKQRDTWLNGLSDKCFRSWRDYPQAAETLKVRKRPGVMRDDVVLDAYDFMSDYDVRLTLYVAHPNGQERAELAVLNVLDEQAWQKFLATYGEVFMQELKDQELPRTDKMAWEQTKAMFEKHAWAMVYIAPRGVGPTAWDSSEPAQRQQRRRLMLLGTTLETLQAFDVRRAIQAARQIKDLKDSPLWLQGERQAAGIALYASLFEPNIARLDLWSLPKTHRDGPHFLNVLRVLDIPQAVALAAERSKVRLYDTKSADWSYPMAVGKALAWDAKQIEVRATKDKE